LNNKCCVRRYVIFLIEIPNVKVPFKHSIIIRKKRFRISLGLNKFHWVIVLHYSVTVKAQVWI